MILRIKNWDKHFENNRTRELKKLSWVPFPNSHDGDGYTELLDHPTGAAHFGCWCAICEVASKCDPRGTLMRDGGKTHDCASLSRMTRIPQEVLKEAIERLITIGWIETYDNPAGGCDAKAAEGCGLPEGKERKKEEEEVTLPPTPIVKNRFFETIQNLRRGHIAFKTVPDVAIENALKGWPQSRWNEAIESLCHHYAGANIPKPIKTLENYLASENHHKKTEQKQINKKSFDRARMEIMQKLEDAFLIGSDSVSRCLSICNDLYRDIPKQDGKSVVDEAYDIFKFRKKKANEIENRIRDRHVT